MDGLREQLEEIQALAATYPEDGALQFTSAEQAALDLAAALTASNAHPPTAESPHAETARQAAEAGDAIPQLSGTLILRELSVSRQALSLHFTLPAGYPAAGLPRLQVDCACDRAHHTALTAVVQRAALECQELGSGCLLLAASALQQEVENLLAQGKLQSTASAEAAAKSAAAGDAAAAHDADAGARTICRCVVWFHHIKALSKRKAILQWASELRLGGFSKPGFPGVIVCEGFQSDVREYISRLRALKWQQMATSAAVSQAMAVRGMEEEAAEAGAPSGAAAARRFSGPLSELGEGCMAQLAAECRAARLEGLFLAALKISR